MNKDRKDTLWELTFATFYDSYFEELLADKLIKIWQALDVITKILVASTASISAVTGWVLWNNEIFKIPWLCISGIAAFLSIIHTALAVSSRLKDWTNTKLFFSSLRIDIETLRGQMEINPDFSIEDANNKFLDLRKRYKEGVQNVKNDILRLRFVELKIQDDLDNRIRDQIL